MMGKRLDLDNPSDFNQKLQWLKLHYKNPLLVGCADKFAVREYVKDRIGARYLNDILGVYSRVDQIPFEDLPNEFVLKATHGSGWNILCPDKTTIDWNLACRKMRKWLRSDFSMNGREWQYREIPPRILCEKYLKDRAGGLLRDYKIFTFNGQCKYIWVDFEAGQRVPGKPAHVAFQNSYDKPLIEDGFVRYRNIYDTQWNFQPDKRILRPNSSDQGPDRPKCLEEMIAIASELSQGIPQCRVDLYVIDNTRIVFGELTFTCGNGCNQFFPESFGVELGQYIELPKRMNNAHDSDAYFTHN
jgi:hypothetical protein